MKRLGIILLIILFSSVASRSQTRLTLDDCINIAMANNPQIKNSRTELSTSKAQKLSSYSSILPRLSFSGSPSRNYRAPSTYIGFAPTGYNPTTGQVVYGKKEIMSPASTTESYGASFSWSQTIWDQGRWWSQIQRAETGVRATEWNFQTTTVNTIANVKARYYGLVKALAQRKVMEESVALAEEQLKRSETMYNIGTVAQIDVFRSKVNLDRSKINLINHNLTIENAKRNLALILGRDIQPLLEVQTEVPLDVNYDISLEKLMNKGLNDNPDIKRFEELVQGSELGVKIAKAARYPSLSYSVNYSRNNSDLERLYTNISKNYSLRLGLTISYNIFDGFQTKSNIRQAENNLRLNEENMKDTKRNYQSTVMNYYQQLMAFKEKIEINKEMILAAEEDLRMANERYRVGSGTLIETIDAQVQLTSARYTLLELQYDALISEAFLHAAVNNIDYEIKN